MRDLDPLLFALAFVALVITLTALGRRLPVPTPILQVGAGLLAGFVPGVSLPQLDPDLVFFVFLPPILWAAAYFTSLREFRANLRPIGLLAIGLVLITSVAVAIVVRFLIPDIPWAVAIALGAIVSPPDAVAATSIVSRLPVPRRVVVILEGESLVNDASALIIYRTAVAAAVTGTFSIGESVVRFFIDAGVGALIGLFVAWLIIRASRVTSDPLAETLLTLAGPYIAWIAAETIHVSAVLACVTGGLYLRQHLSVVVSAVSRIQGRAVWDLVIFTLNALIFVILGLQFNELLAGVPAATLGRVLWTGVIIGLTAIVVRMVWVPVATWLPRRLAPELRRRDPEPSRPAVFLVAWTSMRGIVSLAAALALPATLASGAPFPYRAELIVITLVVIVMTLLAQGLTLAPLIRYFSFPVDVSHHAEEQMARREALRRGAEALEVMAHESWADQKDVEWLRGELRDRLRQHEHHRGRSNGRQRLRQGVMQAERRLLIRLRNEGAISDEVLRDLEQELDLEAMRLGIDESHG